MSERHHARRSREQTACNTSPLVPLLLHEIRTQLPEDTPDEVHDRLDDALSQMLGGRSDGDSDLRQAVEGMLIDGCHEVAEEFAAQVAEQAQGGDGHG